MENAPGAVPSSAELAAHLHQRTLQEYNKPGAGAAMFPGIGKWGPFFHGRPLLLMPYPSSNGPPKPVHQDYRQYYVPDSGFLTHADWAGANFAKALRHIIPQHHHNMSEMWVTPLASVNLMEQEAKDRAVRLGCELVDITIDTLAPSFVVVGGLEAYRWLLAHWGIHCVIERTTQRGNQTRKLGLCAHLVRNGQHITVLGVPWTTAQNNMSAAERAEVGAYLHEKLP